MACLLSDHLPSTLRSVGEGGAVSPRFSFLDFVITSENEIRKTCTPENRLWMLYRQDFKLVVQSLTYEDFVNCCSDRDCLVSLFRTTVPGH